MKNDKFTNLIGLWDEFLDTWPKNRVKNMSLGEYTNSGNQATFTYWLEVKLEKLGSIWGGSAFKFGIYSRNSDADMEDGKGRMYSDQYGWYSKYGDTPENAFQQVRAAIVMVIDSVDKGEVHKIDKINLGHAF